MSAASVAVAHWRALDREGEDKCRLRRTAHGWLLAGHARFRDTDGFAALDYVVRCDSGWRTLSADVAGLHAGRELHLRIHRDGDRWWVNDTPQPDADGATDLDLPFTLATNLMPLRRLMGSGDGALDVVVAWLNYPQAALAGRQRRYAGTGLPDVFLYRAEQTGFPTELTVDRSGFVTFSPGFWEGEVRDEA